MAKSESYHKITSFTKSANTFSYFYDSGSGTNKKRSHYYVEIPGKFRPDDKPPVTYITGSDYDGLTLDGHDGIQSPFSLLLEQGARGGGVIAEKLAFEDLPGDFQKKFDPEKYAKLEAARKKLILEEAEKAEAEKAS